MKKLLLFAVLAVFLGCASADAVELKYKFRSGEKEIFRETRKLVYEFDFMGALQKAVTEEELKITETTQKADSDGALIRMDTKYIKMTENGKAVPAAETPDESFYYRMSPQGKLLELLDKDKKPEKYFDPKAEYDKLPKGDIKVGDTWKGKWSSDGVVLNAVFSLEKLEKQKGVQVAVIKIAIDDTAEIEEEGIGKALVKAKGSGRLYFAPASGKEIMSEMKLVCDIIVDNEPFGKSVVEKKSWRTDK